MTAHEGNICFTSRETRGCPRERLLGVLLYSINTNFPNFLALKRDKDVLDVDQPGNI